MNENEREERRDEEPRVRVMSQDEADNYRGVTIEENPDGSQEKREQGPSYRQSPFGQGSRIHIHTFPQQHGMSWLTKAALVVGGAVVVGFFFFVALPFLLIAVGVGVAAWLLFQWLRG